MPGSAARPRPASALGRGAAVVVATLMALGVFEAGLRIWLPQGTGPVEFAFDPDLGLIPVPEMHGTRTAPGAFSYTYTNDRYGNRVVPRHGGAGTPDDPVVLLLGDSFTYGNGVDDGDTYAARLQALLPRARVVNAAVGGQGTAYALRYMQVRGAALHPRVMVLAFFSNDYCDNDRSPYFELGADGGLRPKPLTAPRYKSLANVPGYSWLVSWSHTANLLKRATLIAALGRGPAVLESRFADCRERALEQTGRYLRALQTLAGRIGSAFVATYVPTEEEVLQHSTSEEQAAFLRLCHDLGMQTVSLLPALEAARANGRLYFPEDGHWTAAGHLAAATALAPEVGPHLTQPAAPQ